MKSIIFLLFLLLTVLSVAAQKKAAPKIDTIIKEVPVYSKIQADSLHQVYFEILKSTNEQLNNYWTPVNWSFTWLSILMAVLGLLFAGGSIWAGIFIYRQGADFRRERERLFEGFSKQRDELLQGAEQQINDRVQEFDGLKESANILIKTIETEGKEKVKEAAEKMLERIQQAETRIATPSPAPTPERKPVVSFGLKPMVKVNLQCPKCGFMKEYTFPPGTNPTKARFSIKCENCGEHVNLVVV
ncbi:MAG: hypothetical protein KF870_07410 [Leadbetterella sp.]|nr:hypothetical protein [Leadbetterella sp.]